MPKVKYDPQSMIRSIKVNTKRSVDSDVSGNVVTDYDKKGNLTKIEIMNFSFNEFKQMKQNFEKLMPVRVLSAAHSR